MKIDFKEMKFIRDESEDVRGWDIIKNCSAEESCIVNELSRTLKSHFKIIKNAKTP